MHRGVGAAIFSDNSGSNPYGSVVAMSTFGLRSPEIASWNRGCRRVEKLDIAGPSPTIRTSGPQIPSSTISE
jgi:hypothetical protein